MEWIVGIFILWLIGIISDGTSKSKNDSAATKSNFREKTDDEPLNDSLKKPKIDFEKPSSKKATEATSGIQISSSRTQKTFNEELIKHDQIPPFIKGGNCSDIEISFNKYGVSSIWHMTHKDNIGEILKSGILSNRTAYSTKKPTDISDHGVQRWRELQDPIYRRKLHDYAPTYVNIKNPMLYVRRDIQHELCIIEIALSALSINNFIISDGNAAARNTNFYNTADDLDKLPWEVLDASYWNSFPDGKRKRCSEVLIYPMIDPKYIIRLHCCSNETLQFLQNLTQFRVPVKISKELFFTK